jgi:ABC-type transporter Mla maintaining outer membrane lipid asymmetry ATPase subunit MlaF
MVGTTHPTVHANSVSRCLPAAVQSGALFDSLTVGENVGFMLYEHTKLPVPKIKVCSYWL